MKISIRLDLGQVESIGEGFMATEPAVLSLKTVSPETAAARAREVLREDGIVAFPTETVYGLAIRGDSLEARERLFQLKNRDPNQQLARYVTTSDQITKSGIPVGLRASQLMKAFWPGPLTIVIETSDGVTHGFRNSSHPVAALIGSDDTLPVYGTSANLSGAPPITEAEEIVSSFGDSLALTIEERHPLTAEASTVLLLPHDGGFKILREGAFDSKVIQAELDMKICIVCTGNTCRSPLAEKILEKLLAPQASHSAQKISYTVKSAGTSAASGMPASRHSQTVAKERNLDLGNHKSKVISKRDLEEFDLILTMTRQHRDILVGVLPECKNRVRPLGGENRDIVDPFGGDLSTYRNCADDIERQLAALMEEL